MSPRPQCLLDPHQHEILNLLHATCGRYALPEIFRDMCEICALYISNSVDRAQLKTREARYQQLTSRYTKAEVDRFPVMLEHIARSLRHQFKDCLGELFAEVGLADPRAGQYFTPYPVAIFNARSVYGIIDEKWLRKHGGFVRVAEPATGSGIMVIAAAQALQENGLNYRQCLHVTAGDLNATAVHMSYVQLSLLHIPAVVVRGDSLAPEVHEHWVTPEHFFGRWDERLRAEPKVRGPAVSKLAGDSTTAKRPASAGDVNNTRRRKKKARKPK